MKYKTLLFYHYTIIEDVKSHIQNEIEFCNNLDIRGRIRVCPEGLNVTADGTEEAINQYIEFIDNAPELHPEHIQPKVQIHFKTGYAEEHERLPNLSIKACKEVVSLDLPPAINKDIKTLKGGRHLTPKEFHEALKQKSKDEEIDNGIFNIKNDDNKNVLIDVRNLYETRIGHFKCDNVPLLDPKTRKFSDFARWIDDNCHVLKNKQVFAYCTGGVRCERATQYMQYKGIQNINQLSGGICAYMEEYPDGGFFKGKNFVYDPRIAVPYAIGEASKQVVGKCSLCSISYDDYSSQTRCIMCRMLVLVCQPCLECKPEDSQQVICEHCKMHNRDTV